MRGEACCFILSSFSIMKLPLITALCAEQAAEAALNGSSARKAPEGEAKNNGKESRREKHFARISRAPHSPRFRSAPSPQGEGFVSAEVLAFPFGESGAKRRERT